MSLDIRREGFFLRLFVISLIIAVFSISFAVAADDDDDDEGMMMFDGDMPTCKTDECHAEYGEKEYVHGPIGIGACAICHKGITDTHPNEDTVDFEMAASGKELCYFCHEPKDTKETVHKPVLMGECQGCHDPHQSDFPMQLKKGSTKDLCFSCHADNKTNQEHVHGPVAAGDCNICHNPHTSTYPKLLEKQGNELCFMCHIDRMAEFTKKYVHKAAEQSCLNCHDPHGSPNKYMLKKFGKEVCFSCHKDKKEHIENAKVQHGALKEGICTNCHTPHSSDFPRQLKAATKDICYTCHKDIGNQVKSSLYIHGPVQQNDCYACHDPHGSDNPKILKKAFPAKFYMPYKTENYALCFDCHNKEIALDPFTEKLTNFRNGDTNLHFKHVNKDPKGRSCKSCHGPHAGPQPKHIRSSVPFGAGKSSWPLPIKFTKTETGGSCEVGCHKKKYYDRVEAVKNK